MAVLLSTALLGLPAQVQAVGGVPQPSIMCSGTTAPAASPDYHAAPQGGSCGLSVDVLGQGWSLACERTGIHTWHGNSVPGNPTVRPGIYLGESKGSCTGAAAGSGAHCDTGHRTVWAADMTLLSFPGADTTSCTARIDEAWRAEMAGFGARVEVATDEDASLRTGTDDPLESSWRLATWRGDGLGVYLGGSCLDITWNDHAVEESLQEIC